MSSILCSLTFLAVLRCVACCRCFVCEMLLQDLTIKFGLLFVGASPDLGTCELPVEMARLTASVRDGEAGRSPDILRCGDGVRPLGGAFEDVLGELVSGAYAGAALPNKFAA